MTMTQKSFFFVYKRPFLVVFILLFLSVATAEHGVGQNSKGLLTESESFCGSPSFKNNASPFYKRAFVPCGETELSKGSLEAKPHGLDDTLGAVIGILTTPYCVSDNPDLAGFRGGCESSNVSAFGDTNVRWLEQAGAKVVPIPYDISEEKLLHLLPKLNGFYFTGGNLSLQPDTAYFKSAKLIYEHVLASPDNVPLLGICMGFQLLCILGSNQDSILTRGKYDAQDEYFPLEPARDTRQSKFLKWIPESVVDILFTENVTAQFHRDGVLPEDFYTNEALSQLYNVVSVNRDMRGLPFISTIEMKARNVIGVQWHPEIIQWKWDNRLKTNRSISSVVAMQMLSNYFVHLARQNNRRFESLDEEKRWLIYNHRPQFQNQASSGYYFFKRDDAKHLFNIYI